MNMKRFCAAVCAAFAGTCAFAADIGDAYLLQTANTTMAFRKKDAAWHLLHYGAKVTAQADADALAWNAFSGSTDLGLRAPVTYAAFGSKNLSRGFNKYGGLAVTHADGCVTTDLVHEKAETVEDAPGSTHLVITLKDRVYPFYVIQHFRARVACDVVETWVELKNGEGAAVKIARMDSCAFQFPLVDKDLVVQSTTGQWASEGQISESAVPRGQALVLQSRAGVHDAWTANPSLMLQVGGKASETHGRVLGGALCWSGMWHITVSHDEVDALELRAGANLCAGPYTLDAGKTVELPVFAFTWSETGKGQVSRNMHKWARTWRLPAGKKLRPVLLNSWEGSYFSFTEKVLHDMMDGVKEMGGELFVLDDGWFGHGKYARDNDKDHQDKVGLGDWQVNPEKLPNGLNGLNDQAKARGLKFGFWVEPEMINTRSWLYEAHPDWVIREKNRPVYQGRGGTQTVLDYTNPAVRDAVFGMLDALYSKIPGLAYIKWDANADFMNWGSTYLDAAHQANLSFDYTVGLYDLLAKCRAKYPDVDIQACSSGGGHMDYGFLKYADEYWTSDNSDARERVYMQWGASQFYPACTMAAHVTASPNHQTRRETPLKYRFDVAFSGRFGFELHPKDMKPEELAFGKQAVADYKRLRPVIQQGDLYRLVSPYERTYASLMYVDESRTHAVVYLYGLTRGICQDYLPAIALRGLDPARRYKVNEINLVKGRTHTRVQGKVLSGAALMGMGLSFRLNGDYDSAVVELVAEGN